MSSIMPTRLPGFGKHLWAAHRGPLVLLAILPVASCVYWFVFSASGGAAWQLDAIALTNLLEPWLSPVLPFWDSLAHRYRRSDEYPTLGYARHLVAICWLALYATVILSLPFMPRFVRTMVAAGEVDPAMAYRIRWMAMLAWLGFVLALFMWLSFATQSSSDKDYVLPGTTAIAAYSSVLWICAVLAHRRLGARWRDFKGPS
jgi:hypothetical protein